MTIHIINKSSIGSNKLRISNILLREAINKWSIIINNINVSMDQSSKSKENSIYKISYMKGIEASRNFLEEAKIKGLVILNSSDRYFSHNIQLWCIWFRNIGIQNIVVMSDINKIKEDDLCIIISHFYNNCRSKKYIAIQTEDLVQRQNIWTNIIEKAWATWDYSHNNINFLIKKYNIQNIVQVPINYSDNTILFKNIIFNKSYEQRNIDIIVPMHGNRRKKIKKQLVNLGLSCISIWRNDLPKYVNKCKIFLNVHRDNENSALEVHRLFDVRNVAIVVISESSLDINYQNDLNAIPFIKYDNIVDLCLTICKNKILWEKYMNEQLEMWKKFNSEHIYSALNTSIY